MANIQERYTEQHNVNWRQQYGVSLDLAAEILNEVLGNFFPWVPPSRQPLDVIVPHDVTSSQSEDIINRMIAWASFENNRPYVNVHVTSKDSDTVLQDCKQAISADAVHFEFAAIASNVKIPAKKLNPIYTNCITGIAQARLPTHISISLFLSRFQEHLATFSYVSSSLKQLNYTKFKLERKNSKSLVFPIGDYALHTPTLPRLLQPIKESKISMKTYKDSGEWRDYDSLSWSRGDFPKDQSDSPDLSRMFVAVLHAKL